MRDTKRLRMKRMKSQHVLSRTKPAQGFPRLVNVTRVSTLFGPNKTHLTRQRSTATPAPATTNGQPAMWDFTAWVKEEDKNMFGVEQLKFLARKRRYQAGKGPAMPEETICPECTGSGIVVCHECKGSAVNDRDMEQIMQNSMENIQPGSGSLVNVTWYFQRGGPCWYCRGNPTCPCRDCEGTGITGFKSIMYNGD